MQPGQAPVNITEQQIQDRMNQYNANTTLVRMVWSDRERGVYVFLTPLEAGQLLTITTMFVIRAGGLINLEATH